jgi:Terpene cyclase DEP1
MDNRSHAYLALAVLGAIVPFAIFGVFVADQSLDLVAFADAIVSSPVALMLLGDLLVSSLAFWVWMSREAPRAGMGAWWPFVVANLLVGLSFALPLFLCFRQRRRVAAPA